MLRVLFIDDESGSRELCRHFLEETGEFVVDTAPSAAAGLEKLEESSYDAIVSDYLMEETDGISLLQTLRSQGIALPVILFTGRGSEDVAIEALNSGADFYVRKGMGDGGEFRELAQKIRIAAGRKKAEESLRETNEYLNNLITHASGPIVIWDIDFRITRFNRAFENLTGFSEAEMLGQDLDILFPAATRARSLDLASRTLFGEKWESAEIPIRTRSGGERTVIWNSANIYARDGTTPLATIAQGTDITERKRAETEILKRAHELEDAYERLATTEEELRGQYEELGMSQKAYRLQSAFLATLLDTIPAPVFYKDRDGKYLGCNNAFETLFGIEREMLPGKTVFDITPRSFAEPCTATDRDVLRNNRPVQYEATIRPAGGPSRDVIFFKAPFPAEEGNPGGVIGIIYDITERKRAEEALRETAARLDLAVTSARMGVWQWDVQKDLRTFDPVTCRFLGIDPAAFTGAAEEFYARVHPDDREMLRKTMARALEEDVPYEPAYRALWPDGSIHYLNARGTVVRDAEGRPLRVNGLIWDVTRQKQLMAELRTSEEKYRRILDTAEEGIWELDSNYRTTYANPKLAAMLGYLPEEMIGEGMSRFLSPEDLADHAIRVEQRKKGRGDVYERQFVKKDGSRVWMLVSATAIRNDKGHFSGSFIMITDITQRKKAEEELRASERRFRAIIRNATDIIRILDRNGIIVFESPASDAILGYPSGYVLGKHPSEFMHPEDRERTAACLREIFDRKNHGTPVEFRVRKADGTYIYVECVGVNLLGVPGIDGIIVTMHPVDERKRAEQALRENQLRLANAMVLSRLVNWEFDVTREMFTFNDRFYTLYATTAEKEGGYEMPAGEYVRRFVYPEDVPLVAEAIRDVPEITDPAFFRQLGHRIIRRDGEVRFIAVRFSVMIGEDGRVAKTYGANQDITEWKEIENQLKQFNEELERKVLERAGELRQALEEKTILLQEIHHRVKNNLQIIVSLIRLQQRKVADPSARSALLDSESRVRSMALVHEKLYRSEDVAHIRLNDYVNALLLSIANMYRFDPGRVKIVVSLQGISLDIHQAIPLGLILNELISNIFKYAFPGGGRGEIRILGDVRGDTITITVQDTGVGIPAGFDWKNTPTLGLHLVTTLVEQLHGTIEYVPAGEGTTFEISIPVQDKRGKA